jgi:hypothetical protein
MDIGHSEGINDGKVASLSFLLGLVDHATEFNIESTLALLNTTIPDFIRSYPEYGSSMNHILRICNEKRTTPLMRVYLEDLIHEELKKII